nr:MAG TPA: hypothetical protein [Caudoviricetes sp.]
MFILNLNSFFRLQFRYSIITPFLLFFDIYFFISSGVEISETLVGETICNNLHGNVLLFT